MAFIMATHKSNPHQELYISQVTNKSDGTYKFDTIQYARIFDSKEDAAMFLQVFYNRITDFDDYENLRII